jgi:cytochrome c1
MRRVLLVAVAMLAIAAAPKKHTLPLIGTQFHQLPAGEGKDAVESACYACHSADLLAQQRLTEKQWTANVEKMTRWGAKVSDADKPRIIAYLSKHFGPENKFTPIEVRLK